MWVLALVGFILLDVALVLVLRWRKKRNAWAKMVRKDVRLVMSVGSHVEPAADLPIIHLDDFDAEEHGLADDDPVESCPAVPIAFDYEALEDETTAAAPLFQLHAVGRTDRGVRRKQNEDAVLVRSKEGLCVVADGMGGHKGGGLASKLAVEAIGEAIENGTFAGKEHPTLPPRASEVARAIQMACSRIRDAAKKDPGLSRMGTTVVAARFSPDKGRLYVGHVGDSRCYRFREGKLERMTNDHTMASFGVVGRGSQLLSRAVGPLPRVLTDVVVARPRIGDVYLLCSDGLTRAVPDELIRDVLDMYWELERAADQLVMLANRRGGHDNVSVVLARVGVHCAAAA
jgi:protein phosphatase